MAFLVIAGITVPVAFDSASKRPPERLGFTGRAYGGGLRTSIRSEKRGWQCRTDYLLDADATTLENAVDFGVQVTVSGDMIGSSVTAVIEVGDGPYLNSSTTDGKGFMRALNLVIREV